MKYFFGAVLMVSFILTTPFSDGNLNSQEPPDDWDFNDWGDAIELDEVTITCSDHGYGRCYMMVNKIAEYDPEAGLEFSYGYHIRCEPTGILDDKCGYLKMLLTAMFLEYVYNPEAYKIPDM